MFFLRAAVDVLPPAFVAAHLILLTVIHLLLAAALGTLRRRTLWAALAFALPVLLALTERIAAYGGAAGVVASYGATMLLCVVWSALPFSAPGSPLVAGVAGALVAAELRRFVVVDFKGPSTEPAAVLIAAALALGGFLLAFAGGRLWPRNGEPRVFRWAAVGWAGAALTAIPTASGGPVPPPASEEVRSSAPPVVVIVLDTMRADHMELYGYERATMPEIGRFASEHAVVVEHATANGPWTLPTHASIFTGLYPPEHGAHRRLLDAPEGAPPMYALRKDVPTLAELLAGHGYWTVGIAGNYIYLGREFGLDRGFQYLNADPNPLFELRKRSAWLFHDAPELPGARVLEAIDRLPPFSWCEFFTGVPYRRASAITDEAIHAIEAAGERSFFLFVNYFDVHWPEYPPVEFRDFFPGRQKQLGLRGLPDGGGLGRPAEVLQGKRDLTASEEAHLSALYDGEARYLDREVGRLLARLEKHPRFDEMLIVITADHGESMGEHRMVGHLMSLYDSELRVPLVIKPSGRMADQPEPGSRIPGPMQSVDVFATVLEHAGLPVPDAVSGSPWGGGRTESFGWLYVPGTPARVAPERFRRELRSVEVGGWKLIASSTGSLELFDLDRDPGELHDLSAEHPGVRDALLARLEAAPRSIRREGSASPHDISNETLDRLRTLGYVP